MFFWTNWDIGEIGFEKVDVKLGQQRRVSIVDNLQLLLHIHMYIFLFGYE